MTYPHPKRSFVPQAVLTRTGKIDTASANVNTAGANVNTAGASINTVNSPINIATSTPIQKEYKEKAVIDSGYSKHMIGNKCYLDEYEDYDGRFVSFGDGKGRISGKVPRKDNIYSVDLKSVVPNGDLTCLIAKAIIDESNTWHRRLGDINFKTINKLMKGNLVKGLPLKIFQNDHSCVACQKGKQHKASYKTKLVNSISKPLHMLHMDLFGPTNVKSLMKKSYCLDVTDDFNRFYSVFFLATKDETSGILKTFITGIENQLDHKVKVIRCDNGTEFKNIAAGNKTNSIAGTKDNIVVGPKDCERDAGIKPTEVDEHEASDESRKHAQEARSNSGRLNQREMQIEHTNSTNGINTVSTPVSTAGPSFDNAFSIQTPVKACKGSLWTTSGPKSMVYVDDIIFGSTKKEMIIEFEKLMHDKFQMSSMGELYFFLGLQVKQKSDEIFISQDKYVAEILKKFDFASVKTASTPMETNKALVKDEEAEDVDVHLYRSMIGSLMYLTTSRPDIMFAVCAVQEIPIDLGSVLLIVTMLELVLTGNPQQEQTAVQVLWIQNHMLDYGFNFMHTKIYIDNESTICVVKNPIYEVRNSSDLKYGVLQSAPTSRPTKGFRADYGFVGTLDDDIRRDQERYVGYGVIDTWDEMVEDMQGTLAATDVVRLSQWMTDFVTTIGQDIYEIYVRLDDAQDDRSLMSGRLNMLYRDRHAHARTARLRETEAKLSHKAWVQSMDASDTTCSEVRALRTTVLAQQDEIGALRVADRTRHAQLVEILTLISTLQTQVTALQRQQGPASGPAQPDVPEEASSSIRSG
ncbi:putative ribonuclease H-like domain-containing protein [Tanacetum coccineum]